MTKLDLQYDLVNYTPASASPPQANFNRVEQHINQELIERDGTVGMNAQLKLVGDPVNPLDAAPKQYVDQILPVGIIMLYGGAAAPPGGRWALCNGAELQTTDYPELSALLGTAYGGSAGRFNLPNLVGRFPQGATPGATGGTADAVVVLHGHSLENHTHGMKSHTHLGADHAHGVSIRTGGNRMDHTHGIPGVAGTGSGLNGDGYGEVRNGDGHFASTGGATAWHDHDVNGGTGLADRGLTTGGPSDNTTDLATGHNAVATGVSGTNANLPPFLGVTYIIRIN